MMTLTEARNFRDEIAATGGDTSMAESILKKAEAVAAREVALRDAEFEGDKQATTTAKRLLTMAQNQQAKEEETHAETIAQYIRITRNLALVPEVEVELEEVTETKEDTLRGCACGCGQMVLREDRTYRQGHDQRHKGNLLRDWTRSGNESAANTLVRLGWYGRTELHERREDFLFEEKRRAEKAAKKA